MEMTKRTIQGRRILATVGLGLPQEATTTRQEMGLTMEMTKRPIQGRQILATVGLLGLPQGAITTRQEMASQETMAILSHV